MDQARFEGLLQEFQARCSSENTIYDLAAVAGQADSPIVVLVHGIGGNIRHWSDPVGMNVNDTWLFDLKANPPKGTNGVAMSPPYQESAAKSWTSLLTENRISYVNFSQAKPGDLLEFAVTELVAILSSLENLVFKPYEDDVASNGGQVPPLILVCHSRGGLVTRAALKQLGSAGVPHLRKVISLSTPHDGSFMPALANDYNNTLHNQMDFSTIGNNLPGPVHMFLQRTVGQYLSGMANMVREAMLHSFGTMAQSPGFDELRPSSTTLANLRQDEQPLPGVQYFSFGGANPTFVNMFLCVMGQNIHLLSTASTILVEIIGRIPDVKNGYGGLAELSNGDSAVATSRSHWPTQFNALHRDFSYNHMQALIDHPLQDAVLQIIRS